MQNNSVGGTAHTSELIDLLKQQLFDAAEAGDAEKIDQLLRMNIIRVPACSNAGGMTALMIAARNGHTHIVSQLLQLVDEDAINVQDLEGNTALHHAYENGDAKSIKALLASGANSQLRNMYGIIPEKGAAPRSFNDFS